MTNKKVGLISLGCAKNLINSEQMLYLINGAGYEPVTDLSRADAVIINTCGFIESAKSEAIDTILEVAANIKEGAKIIVAGCLAQRYREEILESLPEVGGLVGTGSFDDILTVLESLGAGETPLLFGDINAPLSETARAVSTGPGWAYIKIADGCDNRCAYCVIPEIRGKFRSRPLESIVDEARALAESGVRELIVVAQDTTNYGRDLYRERQLPELLRHLCEIPGIGWIRLHYLYPDLVTEELIDTIAGQPKIVKYLDVPIQHIDDGILRRMNRRGTGGEIRALINKLRERIPGLVLRTSVIVGLPGEGESEFEELCDFLRKAKIERAGVFEYSPEEGTPAALMDRPDGDTAAHRAELVSRLQAEILDAWCTGTIGKTLTVLCEGYDEESGFWHGRSWADSPDIDGRVLFSGEAVPGEFAEVLIKDVLDGDLIGECAGG